MERTDFDNELKSKASDNTRAFYLHSNLVSVSTTKTGALWSPINFMTIYYLLHQEVRKTLWRLHNSDKTCFWSIIHTNRDKTITFSRAVRFDSFPRYNRHRIEMIKPAGRHRLTYNISRTYAVRNDWPIQLIYWKNQVNRSKRHLQIHQLQIHSAFSLSPNKGLFSLDLVFPTMETCRRQRASYMYIRTIYT